jgi:hypothetical protein
VGGRLRVLRDETTQSRIHSAMVMAGRRARALRMLLLQ